MTSKLPLHRGLELAASCRESLVSQGVLGSVGEPITDAVLGEVFKRQGILVAYVAMSKKVSAVYMRSEPYALVLVNRTHTIGHQRFSLAHELCHHYFHRDLNTWICTVSIPAHHGHEREANEFAAAFLLPAKGVGDLFAMLVSQVPDVRRAALQVCNYYRVSWQSTVYRLFDLRLILAGQRDILLGLSVTSLARELNLNSDLFTTGRQVQLPAEFTEVAQELLDSSTISDQKFRALLDDLDSLAKCGEESPEVPRQ